LGTRGARSFRCEGAALMELQDALFPKAARVVVAPAEPRRLLLQSACLAGVLQAPLFIGHGKSGESAELHQRIRSCGAAEVFAAGPAAKLCRGLAGVRVVPLADESAVAAAHLRALEQKGAINTLVLANPADLTQGRGGMSALAPWVALQRHAALLLT